tara:strand:- start:7181 stop:7642 length:462 start_codon:yes stop_codon:yes gene_type:complete
MEKFLPDNLLEEILREYLIIHWTDLFSNDGDYPHPQLRTQPCEPFRSSDLNSEHTLKIQDLLIEKFPDNKNIILDCVVHLNKLHHGNSIADTSYSQYLISLTNNNVEWYNTFKQSYLSLPYNEAFRLNGMTLSVPVLEDNSFYYLDVFVPENA